MDFVVRRQDRVLAVEVKAGPLRVAKVSRAARSFIRAYRPACLAVVNAGLRTDIEVDGVPVRFCRPWELDVVLESLEG